jgi:hypothetical protein
MPEAKNDEGDPYLREIMEAFDAQLLSPGGAAALLGVSRKTVHTLASRGRLRTFVGPTSKQWGPKWVYIPMADLAAYAVAVGRPFPKGEWADPPEWRGKGDASVLT